MFNKKYLLLMIGIFFILTIFSNYVNADDYGYNNYLNNLENEESSITSNGTSGGGSNSTYNETYDTWLPNYTAYHDFWYNQSLSFYTFYNGFNYNYNQSLSEWHYNMSDGSYNITYQNYAYNQTGNFNYNQTYTGGTYNVTYALWAYNQTCATCGSTYNETYDTWFPNYTAFSKYWYNMTYMGGFYNSTYDKWAYNQSDGRRKADGNYLYNDTDTIYFNESKLSTIYYNATQSSAIAGTVDAGDLSYTQHKDGNYDGKTINVSEASGSPAIDFRLNYTNITAFNTGIVRYKTSAIVGDYPIIQIWSYDDNAWEDYNQLAETSSFATIEQAVFDDSSHVSGGVVQTRIYKTQNGNTNNHYYIDWTALAKGFGTPAGEEVDPFAHLLNTTYNKWWYNFTLADIYAYNMSDGSYNSTYAIWAYNQSDSIWHYNMSDGNNGNASWNASAVEYIKSQQSLIFPCSDNSSLFCINISGDAYGIIGRTNASSGSGVEFRWDGLIQSNYLQASYIYGGFNVTSAVMWATDSLVTPNVTADNLYGSLDGSYITGSNSIAEGVLPSSVFSTTNLSYVEKGVDNDTITLNVNNITGNLSFDCIGTGYISYLSWTGNSLSGSATGDGFCTPFVNPDFSNYVSKNDTGEQIMMGSLRLQNINIDGTTYVNGDFFMGSTMSVVGGTTDIFRDVYHYNNTLWFNNGTQGNRSEQHASLGWNATALTNKGASSLNSNLLEDGMFPHDHAYGSMYLSNPTPVPSTMVWLVYPLDTQNVLFDNVDYSPNPNYALVCNSTGRYKVDWSTTVTLDEYSVVQDIDFAVFVNGVQQPQSELMCALTLPAGTTEKRNCGGTGVVYCGYGQTIDLRYQSNLLVPAMIQARYGSLNILRTGENPI